MAEHIECTGGKHPSVREKDEEVGEAGRHGIGRKLGEECHY